MEEPYSNREIGEMFRDVKEALARIETQTIKTNGRVSILEREQAEMRGSNRMFRYIAVPLWGILAAGSAWVLSKVLENSRLITQLLERGS